MSKETLSRRGFLKGLVGAAALTVLPSGLYVPPTLEQNVAYTKTYWPLDRTMLGGGPALAAAWSAAKEAQYDPKGWRIITRSPHIFGETENASAVYIPTGQVFNFSRPLTQNMGIVWVPAGTERNGRSMYEGHFEEVPLEYQTLGEDHWIEPIRHEKVIAVELAEMIPDIARDWGLTDGGDAVPELLGTGLSPDAGEHGGPGPGSSGAILV